MNPNSSSPNGWRTLLWPGIGGAVLLVWTIWTHVLWLRGEGVIHGLLAFFLGLLVLIALGTAVCLWQGARQKGGGWLFSREALRLYAWSGFFAISTITLFYAIELWRGKRAWAGVVQEAKARGEPLGYTANIAPSVPDDQNFAKAPIFQRLFAAKPMEAAFDGQLQEKRLVFTERLSPPRKDWQAKELPWLNQEKVDVRAWADYYAGKSLPQIGEEEAAKMLLEAFTRYAGVLDEVRQFSTRPYCRFPIGYAGAPHLVPIRDLINLFGQRASAELILGKGDAAFEDTKLALRLVAYCRQQPSAFSQRVNLVMGALQPVWEGLGSRRWNEHQLAELQNQLEGFDLLTDYPLDTRTDSLYLSALVETVIPTIKSNAPPMDLSMSAEDRRVLGFVRWIYPVGWSLQDQVAIHRFHFGWTTRVLDPKTGRLMIESKEKSLKLLRSSDPFFPVYMTPKLRHLAEETPKDFAFVQTAINLAMVACALERHRLARGNYPEKLEALLPAYPNKLPHDIITGEPLKYRRLTGNEFALYSVGLNRVDDGGKPAPREKDWEGRWRPMPDLRKGDWVWRYSQYGER